MEGVICELYSLIDVFCLFVCFYGRDAHVGSKIKYTLSSQFMKVNRKLNSAIKSNTVPLRVAHTLILEKKSPGNHRLCSSL